MTIISLYFIFEEICLWQPISKDHQQKWWTSSEVEKVLPVRIKSGPERCRKQKPQGVARLIKASNERTSILWTVFKSGSRSITINSAHYPAKQDTTNDEFCIRLTKCE